MRFFIFKSDPNPALHAFAKVADAQTLPKQFGPWHAVGIVREDRTLPYGFDRTEVETAVTTSGYQLFRKKKAA